MSALRELIVALDRRVPQGEGSRETRIAADSAILRTEAVARIDELNHAGSVEDPHDQAKDGNP